MEDPTWAADVPNGAQRCLPLQSEPRNASLDCAAASLNRLASAMEKQNEVMREQNRAMWALIEQTAALIEIGLPDDEEDGAPRYLDGSRISG